MLSACLKWWLYITASSEMVEGQYAYFTECFHEEKKSHLEDVPRLFITRESPSFPKALFWPYLCLSGFVMASVSHHFTFPFSCLPRSSLSDKWLLWLGKFRQQWKKESLGKWFKNDKDVNEDQVSISCWIPSFQHCLWGKDVHQQPILNDTAIVFFFFFQNEKKNPNGRKIK